MCTEARHCEGCHCRCSRRRCHRNKTRNRISSRKECKNLFDLLRRLRNLNDRGRCPWLIVLSARAGASVAFVTVAVIVTAAVVVAVVTNAGIGIGADSG